ncbi:MAG: hypothetical protein C4293_02455 [Nitrospiraceae bacterium]
MYEEVLFIREGHGIGGNLPCVQRLSHLTKATGGLAARQLFIASLLGNISELLEANVILKLNGIGSRVDHSNDDGLRIQ